MYVIMSLNIRTAFKNINKFLIGIFKYELNIT